MTKILHEALAISHLGGSRQRGYQCFQHHYFQRCDQCERKGMTTILHETLAIFQWCDQGVRKSVFEEVRRIGEAQNPGPGKYRRHKRGKRSSEAHAARQTRHYSSEGRNAERVDDVETADRARNHQDDRMESSSATFLERCLIIYVPNN